MEIKKNVLVKVHQHQSFNKCFTFEDDKDILLNTIKCYGVSKHMISEELEFTVVHAGGMNVIIPISAENYDEFSVFYEMTVLADIVTLRAEDYFDKTEEANGGYVFTMESHSSNK